MSTPTVNATSADDKLDFKKIMPVFLVVLIDLLGLTIVIPLLPLFASKEGATPFLIGLLGASYPAMQFFGAPFLGRLSDRYGRKPVLIFSQMGTLLGFILLGLAQALPLLFLSRIIDGLSGANISTAQAIITDSTNEKTRTQGLGLLGAAFGLGFVIGPVIAFVTLAIGGNDYRVPAFVAAGFSALSIFLSWRFLEETHGPEKRGSDKTQAAFSLGAMFKALGYPGIGILLALMFAQQVAFGGFEQILAIFTLNRLGLNAAGNSIVFVFVGIIVVAVQGYYIGKWSRRFGERKLIYLGLVTLTIGLALIAFTPAQPAPWYNRAAIEKELSSRTLPGETPPTQDIAIPLPPADGGTGVLGLGWLMLAMVPVAIGGGVMQPSINSLLTKRVTADERGGILGISTAFLSAANALAPVIGGVLFQLGGGSLPFIAWAVLLGLLLGAAWMLIKPDTEERPARGLSPSAA